MPAVKTRPIDRSDTRRRMKTPVIPTRGENLLLMLRDRSPDKRASAAGILGAEGHREAIEPLRNLWKIDRIKEVRDSAAISLGEFGCTEVIEYLEKLVKEPLQDPRVVREVNIILASLKYKLKDTRN